MLAEDDQSDIYNIFNSLAKLSPIYYIKTFIVCNDITGRCIIDNSINIIQLIISLVIFLFFFSFIIEEVFVYNRSQDNIAEKIGNLQNSCCYSLYNLLSNIFVNFLDFIIHFCSLGIFFLNFHQIISFMKNLDFSNTETNLGSNNILIENSFDYQSIFYMLISIVLVISYIYIYISFIKNVNLIIQYNKELSTHYDHLFSVSYDSFMILLKILISLDNALDINKVTSNKTSYFCKIIILFVFIFYGISLIFNNFVLKKILYLSNHKFNILRLFLNIFFMMIFIFFVIFSKIIFTKIYSVYLCSFLTLIISIFLCYMINKNNYIAIYTTNNYILQMIYILNVKYNSNSKEMLSELTNLMFYHKNYCKYYLNCKICDLEVFEMDEFLLNFYLQIKSVLKNQNLKNLIFSKNDISTFNIIKLLIIENLDKNKIIKLIYKAKRIIEKYEVAKRYDNIYFNILIYNIFMKKLITKNQILKFKIIQCYEETSTYINEALSVVDGLLISLNNGEKQIFIKSSDLFELKNKISKNVLFLSFYQNYFVDTYSIIIYRFIYKNLFNCDINDYVTVYNFEEIKDLVNYMFNNEKLIHIKLDFKNHSMKLLRLGKDLINYRNKSFDNLIPYEFREHCCNQLIKKVKSSDNEENKSFEYIIIDENNNLKNIKINFTILASIKLDEVLLIGQYIIAKENLILLKRRTIEANNIFQFEQSKNKSVSYNNRNIENGKINFSSSINDNNLNKKQFIKDDNKINLYDNREKDNNININEFDIKYQSEDLINKVKNKENDFQNAVEVETNNINNELDLKKKSGKKTNTKVFKNVPIEESKIKKQKLTTREKNQKIIQSNKDLFTKKQNFESDCTMTNDNLLRSEIINFSENLQETFFIKSIWLNKIKAKYNFPFYDLFEKIPENLIKADKTRSDQNNLNIMSNNINEKEKNSKEEVVKIGKMLNILRLNYDRFYMIFIKLLKYLEEEMVGNELDLKLKKFRSMIKNGKLRYFKFDILYDIELKESVFTLYSIKEIKSGDKDMINIIIDRAMDISALNENPELEELLKDNDTLDIEKINSLIKEKDTASVSSSVISANSSKINNYMAADSSRKTITSNDQRMGKFTAFSLFFCIFLIVYCLFFLIVGLQNNNNIRKLYTIRNAFNDFRYFFYHTSLNLFFNIEILNLPNEENTITLQNLNFNSSSAFTNNSETTSLNVSFFNQKFKGNPLIKLNFSKFIAKELGTKLNMLRDIYLNLQNSIYSSHYKSSLDGIFNIESNFSHINSVSNEISVTKTKKYFFESINLFFNHGKVIVDNITKNYSIKLYIINANNGKIDFGSITKNQTFNEIQIKMYELILNYIDYYKNMIEIGDLMNNFFSKSLSDVFNSTYILSFILMGVHIILFFGGALIIKFLHKIINQNDIMLSVTNEQENLKFMRDKLTCIKNLSLLFVENPKKLVININKRKAEYMKKISSDNEIKNKLKRKLKKEETEKIDNDMDYDYNKNKKRPISNSGSIFTSLKTDEYLNVGSNFSSKNSIYLDKLGILIPFIFLFLILFGLYYGYSLIFYFLFQTSYKDFVLTSDFQNKNTDLDNKMMNNLNLLSTMMILNKTDFDLSYDLYGKREPMVMELLTNILKTRLDIKKYKKTNNRFKKLNEMEKNLMNCTFIYENLNDSILFDMYNSYSNSSSSSELKLSLTEICKSYAFMKTDLIDSVFDEISYNTFHLYNLYDSSSKTINDVRIIHENNMFYDVFLVLLIIFRPIRKYSSDFVYENIILMSSANYLVFTIIYLILNIIVDLMIFYVINRLVVKKISDINKHLNNMITCISFKFSSNNNKEKKN